MSRLICFEVIPGSKVSIRNSVYRVEAVSMRTSHIVLRPESDAAPPLTMSRNELATLLVIEEAEIHDELEDPKPPKLRSYTDVTHMRTRRLVDWFAKQFLYRAMMPMRHESPKLESYREVFKAATTELSYWYATTGYPIGNTWSVWTVYHDLLRWRARRYDLAALQNKGVEKRPWRREADNVYEIAQEIVEAVTLSNPHWSKAAIHKEVNKRLNERSSNDSRGRNEGR